MGQMKTTLAHLEYENAQMKRDVAKLRRENREMEDRLVQQEQDNGELAARLDDARNLIRDRGLDSGERAAARGPSDVDGGVKISPAGQSSKKKRRQPVARIPGQFSPAEPGRDAEDGDLQAPSSGTDEGTGLNIDDESEKHTYSPGSGHWSPIASGNPDPTSRVR